MASKKRQHPRIEADIAVSIRADGGGMMSTGRIRNVSLGGVFVEMAPLPFGTELDMTFSLPAGPQRSLRCQGYVAWTTKESPERSPGMDGVGIRLSGLSVADMRALSEYIKEQLGSL